ncbi:NadR type nicotinamide-nucleotide adenylyltransferase [Kordia periserrulae]|uniref:NadR type nicotinamide-nucleotide adenylyltransferase n=1 Tax=Kordia periserrulae TaxID=701523 RepID=A0A2T6BVF3_9FLAO|nr:ATP-binding protein [Kordia periserrulae]PTX60006.1 NadR type nicotinamide-nucleotide adenylyltransferase [Kordia periserrulae]
MEKNLEKQKATRFKIVIVGPESSGKTTLAKQLAAHYKAAFVPEFARIYAEEKQQKGEILTENDVMPIAKGQLRLECEASGSAMMICDTNILSTLTYARIYYPTFKSKTLEKYVEKSTANFYFLTYIDTPWIADSIRDLPYKRETSFLEFQQTLKTYNQPYVLLKGDAETRFQKAVATINKLLQHH